MASLEISLFTDNPNVVEKQLVELTKVDSIHIESIETMQYRSEELSSVITLVIQLSSGIATSFIASWLYEQLKAKKGVEINRRRISLDEKERIREIIEENIRFN